MPELWEDFLIPIGIIILVCPCVAVFGVASGVVLIQRKIRGRKAYESTRPSPPPPLRRKRRALSTSSFSRTLNSNCQLLNRLPPEIRLEIYRYVLGDNLLHLVQGRKKISHVRCRARSDTDYVRRCRPMAANTADRMLPGSTSNGNLALTKTCRQVYRETIDLLYATNVFDLDDPRTLFYFSRSVPHQRLASITKLHVYFRLLCQCWDWNKDVYPVQAPPYDENTWKQFWHTIAIQMPRLADLRLCLGVGPGGTPMEVTHAWIKPLLEIRGLRRFDLDVRYLDGQKAETARMKVAQVRRYLQSIMCSQP